MSFTIGSLFDGSGGFPLAATMCGGTPKWASEVEPYPISVTKSRFPNMKHLGSVTDIKGGEVEPVDVISFGSPCQDLSVAGKRAGLKHTDNGDDETTRSGLFMEAVRIIKEMREATNGVYPRFALWENVPGAFSSNKGEDFRIVLEELIKIVEPTAVMPEVPKAGWPYADSYCGDGWSIAYRVLDAQYWGVPQRRRRIYLVADFRGECAGKVSFEREGLRGYFETGRTPWQVAPGDAEGGVGAADCQRDCIIYTRGYGGNVTLDEVSPTLEARAGTGGNNQPIVCYSINHQGGNVEQIIEDKTGTLTAAMNSSGNNKLSVAYGLEPGIAAREGGHIYEGVSGTLRANAGDNQMAVAYSFDSLASNSMKSKNPHSGCRVVEVAKTLDTTDPNPSKNQGGIAVVERIVLDDQGGQQINVRTDGKSPTLRAEMHGNVPAVMDSVFCLQGAGATSQNSQGMGHKTDISYTLNTTDVHAVAYLANGDTVSGTLCAGAAQRGFSGGQEIFGGEYHIIEETPPPVRYIVRRLTPTECARLQGFPDTWGHPDEKTELTDEEYQFWLNVRNTHAVINGKATKEYTKDQILKWYNGLHTDSSEYKMWGNGIALPNALYVMQGIADVISEEKAALRKWLDDLLK